jgi:hypothetical protein
VSTEGPVGPFFDRLSGRVSTPPLGEEEAALVLRLAKVVADWTERRYAPLTAYAAGLAIGAGAPDRVGQLRGLLSAVESMANEERSG